MFRLFRGYKPDWLYEALPYLYAIAGIVTIVAFRSNAGSFSGGLLIAAGLSVWKMRRDYRRQVLAAQNQAPLVDDENAGLVRIAWRSSFNVGHAVIDMQHRQLFELGNEIINAVLSRRSHGEIELLMQELVADIENHFDSEERIMAEHDAPLSEPHKEIHRTLLQKVKSYQDRFHRMELSVGELVGFIAYDVVSQHIIKEDLKFKPQADI